jgi:ArsR family transcriptional regulator
MYLMEPNQLFTILSDPTRLRALMLIQAEGEVCVCEFTHALDESQPKISRHLAVMREAGVVDARREGTWMHYRLHPGLPGWAKQTIESTHHRIGGLSPFSADFEKLVEMNKRPEKNCA